ncbi:hypothetical protein [Pseudooceanicola sp. MF1-13]|uniref:hypothetical protein n=1 Tax=Pseudooceanicola sp. MF1-13 TaxID=3379095 RepID=UPI003891AB11
MRDKLGSALDDLISPPDPKDSDTKTGLPVHVIAASPGSGKSRVTRELMAKRCDHRIAYHTPTLKLAEEAEEDERRFGSKTRLLRGRSAPDPGRQGKPMCRKSAVVDEAAALGVNITKSFCGTEKENACRHHRSCAYLRQRKGLGKVQHVYQATASMDRAVAPKWQPAVRVVDEAFWTSRVHVNWVLIADFLARRPIPDELVKSASPEIERKWHARSEALEAANKDLINLLFAGKPLDALGRTAKRCLWLAGLESRLGKQTIQINPSDRIGEQRKAIKEAKQARAHAAIYAAIWYAVANALKCGRTFTERVTVDMRFDEPSLRVCGKTRVSRDTPLVLLDADADKTILAALGCDVRSFSQQTLRPNAEVVQVADHRMPNASLLWRDGANELRRKWVDVIRREVLRDTASGGQGVLVGATRKVVKAFFEDAGHNFEGWSDADVSSFMLNEKLHGASWLWFGDRSRGLNTYEHLTTVVVIGRNELPVSILEDYGRALFGDDPSRNLDFMTVRDGKTLPMPMIPREYEMKSRVGMAVDVPYHPDPSIRCLQEQFRERGIAQLIDRLRLARAKSPKRVVLGCNIPIPGLPVDELVAWEELVPARTVRAAIAALEDQGGIRFNHSDLAIDAPNMFGSAEEAKQHLKHLRKHFGRDLDVHAIKAELGGDASIVVVELQQDLKYKRPAMALLRLSPGETARSVAEHLWGPLKYCTEVEDRAAKSAA